MLPAAPGMFRRMSLPGLYKCSNAVHGSITFCQRFVEIRANSRTFYCNMQCASVLRQKRCNINCESVCTAIGHMVLPSALATHQQPTRAFIDVAGGNLGGGMCRTQAAHIESAVALGLPPVAPQANWLTFSATDVRTFSATAHPYSAAFAKCTSVHLHAMTKLCTPTMHK
jgi:hypothetical protein